MHQHALARLDPRHPVKHQERRRTVRRQRGRELQAESIVVQRYDELGGGRDDLGVPTAVDNRQRRDRLPDREAFDTGPRARIRPDTSMPGTNGSGTSTTPCRYRTSAKLAPA
ncbi:hypothetical protein OG817_15340 [Kribbella sp. NBC_00889]|nr:hypothetical protein OG817_15340 [Kribbella sp. NBC_00889]